MRFCPKCGGIMLPVKQEAKVILRCQRCGYTMEPSEKELATYRSVSKPDEKAKVISTKVVSKARKARASKEELEQAREDYYEFVLEQIGEYGE